jgi:2'-5' RNA ligase
MDSFALIIVPPREILDFVDEYRKRYAKYTNYVIPPHFTIYPPFYSNFRSESELIDELGATFSEVKPRQIAVTSVGYFEGENNVAFLEPTPESSAFLVTLLTLVTERFEGKVRQVYADYNFTPSTFTPHMTIAEKIPDWELPAVKDELGQVQGHRSFEVKGISLYKQPSGSLTWSEVARIEFGHASNH